MKDFSKEDLKRVVKISQEAGKIILGYHQNAESFSVENKEDESPVTTADLEASDYILKKLKDFFPHIPSLSEESLEIDFEKRLGWQTFFLIDPLDGTKEFIKGSGEFTVNIALIDKNRVIAGVVYLPVLDETYYSDCKQSFLIRDGKENSLPLKKYNPDVLNVVSSKSHKNEKTENFLKGLENSYPSVNAMTFGSSLKICKVAEGVADMNPRLGKGTKEWDIAAAHAVLLGAGGDIIDLHTKERVPYNKESLFNPEYIALRYELLDREG